jgi:hypothetical protein
MIWTLPMVLGQFFDAIVGQTLDGLGRRPPQPRAPRATPWPGRPSPGPPAVEEMCGKDPDKSLEGEDVKLVRYAVVSLRPCHEGLLPGGAGQVLVTASMTGEGFATWIVACYLESADHPPIPHGEKKYLHVAYEVLTRWPYESLCCEERPLAALRGIRDALDDLQPLQPQRSAEPPVPSLDAPAWQEQEQEQEEETAEATEAGTEPPPPPVQPLHGEAEEEAEKVLRALRELGVPGRMSDLTRRTGLSRKRVSRSLQALTAAGRAVRTGDGLRTRYHALPEGE